jgi:hypothetical protein
MEPGYGMRFPLAADRDTYNPSAQYQHRSRT